LVIVVLAVVVLPLVDTVVVALVLPDLVVTVLVDAAVDFWAATAGVAIRAAAATDAINFFICFLLVSGKTSAGGVSIRLGRFSAWWL
jgi:hypothetical protein